MNFGTKGCEYNCGDSCTGECRKKDWEDLNPKLIYIDFKAEEDAKRERLRRRASGVTEDMKSEFIFNGEHLYVSGNGHSFGRGFFVEYITKSAIVVRRFGDRWLSNGEEYTHSHENGFELVILQKLPDEHPGFGEFVFPTALKVAATTMSLDLVPLKPMDIFDTIDEDVKFLMDKYLQNPSSSRTYKNLIQILEAHHIYHIKNKENE